MEEFLSDPLFGQRKHCILILHGIYHIKCVISYSDITTQGYRENLGKSEFLATTQ